MARRDGKAENQHYVPKMLLRNFAFEGRGKQPQIHVFDKHTDREFTSSIGNVVAERAFYDFPDSDASFEPWLVTLETNTAAAFRKLLEARRLDALAGKEALWIANFVAVQFLRAKNFRENARAMNEAIVSRVKGMGGDPDRVKGWRPFRSEEDIKVFALSVFPKATKDLSESLFQKRWALFETRPEAPFWLSDNPVALHNDRDFGPYGNIGFKVPGIQIYLPLSPTLMLALWCPTHEAIFRAAARQCRESLAILGDRIRRARGYRASVDEAVLREVERTQLAHLELMLANIDAGRPTPCNGNEVMFLNSLQVFYADRYVLSSAAGFDLVRKMIADNPARRRGSRVTF